MERPGAGSARKTARRVRRGIALIACLAAAAPALADVVVLRDGRTYEGKVISQDAQRVRIDTKIGRARTSIGFPASDVESVTPKPLPAGFFEPPPVPERVSDPKKFRPGQPLYLEVPIAGLLGKEVFADGVAAALAYAKRNQIQHVVFTIDSEGGDRDEAVAVYDLLKQSKDALKYHIVARKCLGPALVFPVWASSIQILPGGKLAALPVTAVPAGDDAAEEEMSRVQLAYKVVAETARKGLGAAIVRAMIDPDQTLCVWRDGDGRLQYDAACPDGAPKEGIVLSVGGGAALELTHEIGKSLGMKDFTGNVEDLGATLGLEGWAPESDYGIRTMARIAAEKQKAAKAKQTAQDAKVAKNVSRRQTTEDYISHCLKEAAAWDPTKGDYETYASHYGWGWGWTTDYPATKYTVESQKKWRTRTDASRYYIECAAKALKQMETLEKEAVRLGLDPMYKDGEIRKMIQDLDVRYQVLGAHRDTTGK